MQTKVHAPRSAPASITSKSFEPFRAELTAHCYRMLGSFHDAEDVLQDVMANAWAARDSFDGRSSVRTWLYRIATNLCLDELRGARRRLREAPARLGEPLGWNDPIPRAEDAAAWIGPFPDRVLRDARSQVDVDPEAKYLSGESVQLAFIAALQRLSPAQRAVLILRDVMGWRASAVAELLRISVSAVNSSLHRARGAIAAPEPAERELSARDRDLLKRYVHAWMKGDAGAVAALLSTDAVFSMPPNPAWFRGRDAVRRFLQRIVLRAGIAWRFLATEANGAPAFGVYTRKRGARAFEAHGLHVVHLARGRAFEIVAFLDPSLFPHFGLPLRLEASASVARSS